MEVTAKSRGRPRTDARDRIMVAARRLIGEKGYEATSVPEIVTSAGVAQGTFYNYFQSKSELILAFAEQFNTALLGNMSAVFNDDRPVLEILQTAPAKIMEVFLEYQEIIPLIHDEIMPFGSSKNAIMMRNAHIAKIAQKIERDQAAGIVRTDISAAILARLASGLFIQIARSISLDESDIPVDPFVAGARKFIETALVEKKDAPSP